MSSSSRRDAPRTQDGASQVWQNRTDLVKREIAAASAAVDAKTAKLKALRLAKEAEEAAAADAKTAKLKALRLAKEAQEAEAPRLEATKAPARPGKRGG